MNEHNGEQSRSRRPRTAFLGVVLLVAISAAVGLFVAVRNDRGASRASVCSNGSPGTTTGTQCLTPVDTNPLVPTQQPAASPTSPSTPTYPTATRPSSTATGEPTLVPSPTLTVVSKPTSRPGAASVAVPSTRPGVASVYRIVNQNATALNVQEVYTSTTGQTYVNWTTVPPRGDSIVRMQDVNAVPNGFRGKVTLYASRPFTATLVADPPQ